MGLQRRGARRAGWFLALALVVLLVALLWVLPPPVLRPRSGELPAPPPPAADASSPETRPPAMASPPAKDRVGAAGAGATTVRTAHASRSPRSESLRSAASVAEAIRNGTAGAASTASRGRRAPRVLAGLHGSRALRLEGETLQIAGTDHAVFRLQKQGLPVLNRGGRIHARGGRALDWSGHRQLPPLAPPARQIDRERAVALARAAVPGQGDRALPRAERGWFAAEGETVPAWRVALARSRPLGSWWVTLDARSGRVLERFDGLRRLQGEGRVYAQNRRSTPVPSTLRLFGLDSSGFLSGRAVQIFDVKGVEAFRPDRVFVFDEDDPRFVQTSLYRNLTDAARYVEAQGFPDVRDRIPALANLPLDPGEELNNAFYDPFFPMFGFGNGDGVETSNLGTDRDVAMHEMGHHIFQRLVDPLSQTSLGSLASVNEAFADTLPALASGDPQIGESTIPGEPYLRSLDNDAEWPEDANIDPHLEGLIFGGLHWDLSREIGRDRTMQTLLAALPYLDPNERFSTESYLAALLAGDRDANDGRYREEIAEAAEERGILSREETHFYGAISESEPERGFLADGQFRVYVFFEYPGSKSIDFSLQGDRDVDLFVAAASIFDPEDPDTFAVSTTGGKNERIVIDGRSRPSVDAEDTWIVFVEDFPNTRGGNFELSVRSTLPDPNLSLGGSLTSEIRDAGEVDLHLFRANRGQVVRLEVTALAGDMDLAAAIFDPQTVEVVGGDDDSGPGLDPLIQGALIPRDDEWAIAVFSVIADVDPVVGTGRYRLDLTRCVNSGPDTDNDGLVDTCDDDDDNDGFVDARDAGPRDAGLCADVEDDGCDDCWTGSYDPFNDGPNADGDHLCDLGDPDDDNDGCSDLADPDPLRPSIDSDVDARGDDCDNCPDDWNPDQLDRDRDGLGDVCDPTPVPEPGATAGWVAVLAALAILTTRRFAALRAPGGQPYFIRLRLTARAWGRLRIPFCFARLRLAARALRALAWCCGRAD